MTVVGAGWGVSPRVASALAAAEIPPSKLGACRRARLSNLLLNFFVSSDNAERWLDAQPQVHGQVMTMPEAVLAGRAVFGEVLKEA